MGHTSVPFAHVLTGNAASKSTLKTACPPPRPKALLAPGCVCVCVRTEVTPPSGCLWTCRAPELPARPRILLCGCGAFHRSVEVTVLSSALAEAVLQGVGGACAHPHGHSAQPHSGSQGGVPGQACASAEAAGYQSPPADRPESQPRRSPRPHQWFQTF